MKSGGFPKEEIAGIGSVSSGTYGSIEVAGVGTGHGEIVVRGAMEVAGVYRHTGHLTVNELEVAGTARVSGDVDCERAEIAGAARVSGRMRAKRLEVAGRLRVGGDLRGAEVDVGGQLRIGGELGLERLHVEHGSIRVGELLTAETIVLRLRGRSAARSVGGSSVVVRRSRWFDWGAWWRGGARSGWDEAWDEEWDEAWDEAWDDTPEAADRPDKEAGLPGPGQVGGGDERDVRDGRPSRGGARPPDDRRAPTSGLPSRGGRGPLVIGVHRRVLFCTGEIEADRVDLVATRARVIRADRVALGEGCDVGVVEARELQRHPSARVGRFIER